ncbi:MAG: exodeoxyribonuclease VII small subunit [Saprospiraceae bacterium]|jgi:exodeoxyribonuclease VII small subunit|nr:exodeoxyribonuclease VII small subunit [Saprospiraceae bacterium]MDP4998546.1 exodeoxyribonuclease VII small subunit [Saprospiraceae bacterium]
MEAHNYEAALQELQQIVDTLQSEFRDPDELMRLVARGNELILFCKDKLRATAAFLEEDRLSGSAD